MTDKLTKFEIDLWKKPTIEVLGDKEKIQRILDNGIRHYIGYEISGYVHIGTGLITGSKIVDLQKYGYTEVFMADWHAWINNKLGGNFDNIKKVALGYFKHIMKESIKILGGDPDKTNFVLASDIYNNDYWATVIKIAKDTTINRIVRSVTIMGRKESESNPSAYLIYPLMQAADIIFQKLNIAHGGIDQRKIHVITMEYANKINYDLIALHHDLITNLQLPQEVYNKLKEGKNREAKEELSELKMSKSIPGSAIFVHDPSEKIKDTIMKAFCPQGETEYNPIFEIIENIVFREQENYAIIKFLIENKILKLEDIGLEKLDYNEYYDKNKQGKINWESIYKILEENDQELYKYSYKDINFEIINQKTGERKIYNKLWELRKDWMDKKIHPLDLKFALYRWLDEFLSPIRKYIEEGEGKKYKEDLDSLTITR